MSLVHAWAGRQNQQDPVELRVNSQLKSLVTRIKWDIKKSLTCIFFATLVIAEFTFIPVTFKPPVLSCIVAPVNFTTYTLAPTIRILDKSEVY